MAAVTEACGLRSCSAWAYLPRSLWDLPGPGIKPTSPALAAGLFTRPPGKSRINLSISLGSHPHPPTWWFYLIPCLKYHLYAYQSEFNRVSSELTSGFGGKIYKNSIYLLILLREMLNLKISLWEFPGRPVVKTPCFQCWGYGFNPWLGNQDPASLVQCGQNEKKQYKAFLKFPLKPSGISGSCQNLQWCGWASRLSCWWSKLEKDKCHVIVFICEI